MKTLLQNLKPEKQKHKQIKSGHKQQINKFHANLEKKS